MSDTPTQLLPESGDPGQELVEERKKSRTLLYVLIGVGAALLAAIIVLLVLLLGNGASGTPTAGETTTASPTPTASDTPSATPTPTPTPTPEPEPEPTQAPQQPQPDTSPGFVSFTQTNSVSCNQTNPPGYTPPTVSFTYSTKNASSVWFIMGEGDAANAGAFPMPLTGSQIDVYGPGSSIEYPCGAASQKYTLTIVGQSGQHVHKTFTVVNNGDKY